MSAPWYSADTSERLEVESVAISYLDDQNLTDQQKAQALKNLGLTDGQNSTVIDGGGADG